MRDSVGEVDHEEVELLLEPLGPERVVEQEDEEERRARGADSLRVGLEHLSTRKETEQRSMDGAEELDV